MKPEIIKNSQINPTQFDENILVVKQNVFFQNEPAWSGIKKVNFDEYINLIEKEKEFLPRSLMELDFNYKQIIPYLIFTHNEKYFLMQRQAKASEQRLKSKYSLGIGGHIRDEDIVSSNIIEWSKREFQEEVDYNGTFTVEPLGILNDDSNEVGKVHVGLVLLLHGNSQEIKVKSELKSGQLLTLEECELYYNSMESWTQFAFDFIKNKKQ